MGGFVGNIIFFRNQFETVSRLSVVGFWPVNPLRTESAGHSNDVEQVPARATVLPLPLIRVVKIAPEKMLEKFIVEADGVKAEDNRFGGKNLVNKDFREFAFFNSLL